MFGDLQILGLCLKRLVRILAWPKGIRIGLRVHLLHLLSHLTRSVLITEDENEDALQAEQAQEIPRQTRHPSYIKITGHDARLQHGLEADSEREGKAENDEAGEEGVDPRHDEGLGDHHGHVAFHHAHHAFHGSGIRHGVGCGLATGFRAVLEEGTLLVVLNEIFFAGRERRLGKGCRGVGAQVGAEDEGGAFAGVGRGRGWFGRGLEEDGGVVTKHAGEDHDNGDGEEDP